MTESARCRLSGWSRSPVELLVEDRPPPRADALPRRHPGPAAPAGDARSAAPATALAYGSRRTRTGRIRGAVPARPLDGWPRARKAYSTLGSRPRRNACQRPRSCCSAESSGNSAAGSPPPGAKRTRETAEACRAKTEKLTPPRCGVAPKGVGWPLRTAKSGEIRSRKFLGDGAKGHGVLMPFDTPGEGTALRGLPWSSHEPTRPPRVPAGRNPAVRPQKADANEAPPPSPSASRRFSSAYRRSCRRRHDARRSRRCRRHREVTIPVRTGATAGASPPRGDPHGPGSILQSSTGGHDSRPAPRPVSQSRPFDPRAAGLARRSGAGPLEANPGANAPREREQSPDRR